MTCYAACALARGRPLRAPASRSHTGAAAGSSRRAAARRRRARHELRRLAELHVDAAVRPQRWDARLSSLPAARRVWTLVAAPPRERQPGPLAGRRGLARPQAPGDCCSPWPSRRCSRTARTRRLASS